MDGTVNPWLAGFNSQMRSQRKKDSDSYKAADLITYCTERDESFPLWELWFQASK